MMKLYELREHVIEGGREWRDQNENEREHQ